MTNSLRQDKKKTIREWEQEYGLYILDMDGFDQSDSLLYDRLFTRNEFEKAIASCTVMHRRRPNQDDKQDVKQEAAATVLERGTQPAKDKATSEKKSQPAARSRKKGNLGARIKLQRKPLLWLAVLFTLPTLITLLINWLYQRLSDKVQIQWYWPAILLGADVLVILVEPLTPILAGPFFVWYLVLGWLAYLLGSGTLYVNQLMHRHSTIQTDVPFLSSVTIGGNPMNLYFSFGKAITSSIVLAIAIVCITHLARRVFRRKELSTDGAKRPVP